MAQQLLRDTSPVVAEILDGAHDAVLQHIEDAARRRRERIASESGLRADARVRVNGKAEDWRPDLIGSEGTVVRVNPKYVRVAIDGNPRDFNFPPDWLEVIS